VPGQECPDERNPNKDHCQGTVKIGPILAPAKSTSDVQT